MLRLKGKDAVASNGKAAVLLGELSKHIVVLHYAPSWIGEYKHRKEFDSLCDKAAKKLGYKRDRRCKYGWRKTK